MNTEELKKAIDQVAKAAEVSSDPSMRRAAAILYALYASLCLGADEVEELTDAVILVTKRHLVQAGAALRAVRR